MHLAPLQWFSAIRVHLHTDLKRSLVSRSHFPSQHTNEHIYHLCLRRTNTLVGSNSSSLVASLLENEKKKSAQTLARSVLCARHPGESTVTSYRLIISFHAFGSCPQTQCAHRFRCECDKTYKVQVNTTLVTHKLNF